ncbi:hypothetical protein F5Y18DRAFT_297646 [Xylariaceae sp. FL1019]|nr:hypothetical protein F5Y18DRAFT_297646 [Xylariaceae sp. FL1019]
MEPVCGPSNAFKGLARHLEQDRSHQQDRFVGSSQQGSQNFRTSQPTNNAAAGQFASFQQQNASLSQFPASAQYPVLSPSPQSHPPGSSVFSPQQMQLHAPLSSQSHMQSHGFASNTWINDFQRMNVSGNDPARTMGGQQAQMPIAQQGMHGSMSPSWSQPAFQGGFSSFQPSLGFQPSMIQNTISQSQGHEARNQINEPLFSLDNQAQFDKEFDDIMNDWMAQNAPATDTKAESTDQAQVHGTLAMGLDAASVEPVGQETTENDRSGSPEANTELSRAAQQLVESVADNESDKFKNSEFLALMRRIASQQLTVQGNDFVETSRPPSTEAKSTKAQAAADQPRPELMFS